MIEYSSPKRHTNHIHMEQLLVRRGRSSTLLREGMTHVMLACCMDLWYAQ